jgi:hypothetical protein
MEWAMRSASVGDDAMAIVARAQLFADFVLGKPERATAFKLPAHTHS